MVYNLETKEKARMLWLKGMPLRQVAQEIGAVYTTIFKWSVKYNWQADLAEITSEVNKKTNKMILNDIDKMNQTHLAQLAASHMLIRDARARVEALIKKPGEYKPYEIRALTGAMRDLTAALETTLKNERLIRNVSTEHRTIEGDISWREIIYETEKVLNEDI